MFDLIIEWVFNVAAVVTFVCMTALAACSTVVLIKMIKEGLKK